MATPEIESLSIPALPDDLLETPLHYIAADHDRLRAVCAYLKRAAREGIIDGASAQRLAAFFRDDVKRHFEDERISLYPALLSRSADDAEFVQSIRKVEAFHAASAMFIDYLATHLAEIPHKDATRLPPEFSELIADYAEREYQSLAFENSVIMSIAGVRHKKGDVERMRVGMKARRGLPGP
jgi:hypothetical protein